MKKSTKIGLVLTPAFSILMVGILWLTLIKPWLLKTISAQIPKINEIQKVANITVGGIDFSLLKLQAYASDVKAELIKDPLNIISIPKVKIQIDPFNLLIGQLHFSYLRLHHPDIQLNETILHLTEKSNDKEINLKPLFDLLPKIPLNKLILNSTKVQFELPSEHLSLKSNIALITVNNQTKSLILNLTRSQNILSTVVANNPTSTEVQLSGQVELQENKFEILKLKAWSEKSSVQISGVATNLQTVLTKPELDFKTEGLLVFENLKSFYYFFDQPNKRLPQIMGQLNFNGQVKTQSLNKNSGTFEFKTENLQFDFIKFGNANIKMNLKNNDISFDQIKMDHPAAQVHLTHFEFSQEKPYKFKSHVQIDNFNLQKMFSSLELKDIPADFNANVTGDCSGQFMPLSATCDAKIDAEDISVKANPQAQKYIAQLKRVSIAGNATLTSENVTYQATGKIKTSEFSSTGSVHFDKGFDLKFKSANFKLDDIDNLANLNLRGLISGDLATSGDSKRGIISAKISSKNFIIDRFKLGQLNADMDYKQGELSLTNITGEIEQSLYKGLLHVNFPNSSVDGDVTCTKLNGKSLLTILNDRLNLPFTLTGNGQAKMAFAGPFDFWKLKYQLTADLQRGAISDESFTSINAELHADGDKIHFDKVHLNKPSGSVNATGFIDTTGSEPKLNLDISSQNLKIEEIDHFTQYLPKSTGVLALNTKVTNTLDQAEVRGQAAIKDLTIETQPLLSSQGDIVINKNYFHFNGQIFGRQAQANFQIPFNNQHDFLLKAQLRDFNPLILLPLIKIPTPTSDTISQLTADIDVKSNMNFSDLKGTVKLNQFLLQRSIQSLKLQKPSEIVFGNDYASSLKSISPILLKGPDQELEITQNHNILNLNGKLSLRSFQFLVPFLENLNGQLDVNFGLNLSSQKLSLAGEGSLKNALVQFKGFPYPIKDINATLDFSQSKLIITNLQAQLNQSPLTGFGSVNFISSRNIDLNIQAESSRVDLEFPPQIQTTGVVKVKAFGQWMPYTLKIDYLIDQGLVSKEFSGGADDSKYTLTPSKYLPPKQLSQQTPSLLFDISAKFNKDILIKNQIIEGQATGDLKITGSPELPIISGRVDIQPGSKLFFKDKPFDIQTGFVLFNPNEGKSPEINPEVFINASARVTDYDINLLISGQAKNLSIQPTSQPPLNKDDIFSLLALGFTSSKQDQNMSSETQQKQTGLEVIAAISNQSKINKQIQEKLGLNVQIAPSVDSTKNIAVPKVIVSKKLSKKINASYARPLTGAQQSNEVKVQWLFHPDFSLNLNYQNQIDSQETNIIQNNQNEQGNYGVDLEYKKEFK